MTFVMGMVGFLLALSAYAAGRWQERRAAGGSRSTVAAPPDEKQRQEWHNFWHYDGTTMPKPPEGGR